jgi:VanZ family protein
MVNSELRENLLLQLDVQCSLSDVRRFRADHRFQTPDLWMKSFLKHWLPLLIWLGVIFAGSTTSMSTEHTSRYIVPLLLWLKPGISPKTSWIIVVVIRKCAHISEYAVLSILLWRALGSLPALRKQTLIVFGAVLLGCALFAASDEFHQIFVKSRTPSVHDVLLDIAGALFGLLIVASFARRDRERFRAARHSEVVDAQS